MGKRKNIWHMNTKETIKAFTNIASMLKLADRFKIIMFKYVKGLIGKGEHCVENMREKLVQR